MRLQFDLDTDPLGIGRRARWWAILLVLTVVIIFELVIVLGLLVAVLNARDLTNAASGPGVISPTPGPDCRAYPLDVHGTARPSARGADPLEVQRLTGC